MSKISKAIKHSRAEDWFYCSVWGVSLVVLVNAVLNRIGLADFTPFTMPIIFTVLFFAGLKQIKSRFRTGDFVFVFFLIFVYALQVLLYPQNFTNLDAYKDPVFVIFELFPYFLIGVSLDINRYYKPFYYISIVAVFFSLYTHLIYAQEVRGAMEEQEDMVAAYAFLPCYLFTLWGTFKEKNFLGIIASVLGTILLFSFGNRGTVVCTMFFLTVYFFLSVQVKKWVLIPVAVILYFIFKYLEPILFFFQTFMVDIGMSSRVFDSILEDQFLNYESSSGRDSIANALYNALDGGPIFGFGIYGSNAIVHTYPHNLAIEMWISFGWIIGSFILIAIAYLSIKAFLSAHTDEEKKFLVLMFVIGVFMLFLSSTFMNRPYFFMYLGYCIYLIRNKSKVPQVINEQIE